MQLKIVGILLAGLVVLAIADGGHHEDHSDRSIRDYHCQCDEFELELSDAACVASRKRSEDHRDDDNEDEHDTRTASEEDENEDGDDDDDCENSIRIRMKEEDAAAVISLKRELETGDTESESRLKASWFGAGIYTCNATTCREVESACTEQITGWTFTCPDRQPAVGMFNLTLNSVPAGAVSLLALFTTNATTSQLPSEVEILVSGNASVLGCSLEPGQLFCLAVAVEADCELESDDSETHSEAVGCGAVSFAWATTDAAGTPILTRTVGDSMLFCVDTETIVSWDPTIISLGSTASLIATTTTLLSLVL